MTIYANSTLKTFFETGDVPQGSDYANLIDSCVNLAQTAEQDMAGPLYTTKLITPKVSAGAFNTTGAITGSSGSFSGIVSANGIALNGVFGGNVSAGLSGGYYGSTIHLTGASKLDGTVSAGNSLAITNSLSVGGNSTFSGSINSGFITCTGVSAGGSVVIGNALTVGNASTLKNIVRASGAVSVAGIFTVSAVATFSGGVKSNIVIVSAVGTAQSTAAPISISTGIVRLQGASDGQTTGYLLPSPTGNLGIEQTLCYEGSVSANLWPNLGCAINGLGTNAVFPLVANTNYLVIYKAVSAYGVK